MNIIRHIITSVLLLTVTVSADTWTRKTGTTIDAEFVKEKFGNVYLKTADGSVQKMKTSDLKKADQDRIAQLTNSGAKKKSDAATAKASDAMYDLFGGELRNSEEKTVSVDALANKTIGIYFSAHWCPPCRAFTPELVKFHNDMTRKGKPFEIVFVSSDRDSDAMYNYMEEMDMPWLALPFGDDHKQDLAKKYKVSGIPKLVIIDSNGKLITENGKGSVSQHGKKAFENWK